MCLRDRFEILGLKRDDGARSFEAREIATGRPVLVHFLPLDSALLKRVVALPDSERGRVIDRGEEAGEVYLVTDRLAEFPGLSEWLHQGAPKTLSQGGAWQIRVPDAPPPSAPPNAAVDRQLASLFDSPPPVPAPTLQSAPVLTNTGEITLQIPARVKAAEAEAPPANAPGEFTRQFNPVVRPVSVRRPEPRANQPPPNQPGEFTREFAPILRPTPPPVAKTEPPAASSEPGEFTKIFHRPTLRPPEAAPPAAPSTLAAPSTPAAGPGEFTQMLQAQRPAGSPAPAPVSASQESEFTKFFQSPMAPGGAPLAPPIPPRQNFQPGNAGEFTQVFGVGDIPAPPPVLRPSPPPVAPISPETMQTFEKPRVPAFSPNASFSPSASGAMAPTPPGEYTRQFSTPAPLTFGQPSSVPQVPRAPVSFSPAPGSFSPVRKQTRLPLILIAGAVVLLAAALLVYFVMRSHSA